VTSSIPAGWFVNPENENEWRWWDGVQWTNQVAPIIEAKSMQVEEAPIVSNELPSAQELIQSVSPKDTAPLVEVAVPKTKSEEKPKKVKKIKPKTYDRLEFSVVGEASYQKDLAKLLKKYGEGSRALVGAYLVPEPKNKYDKNAVAVKIYDKVVGYLSSNDAKSYHETFKPYCAARARISAGTNYSGGNIFVNITLVSAENGPLTPEAREYFRL